MMLLVIVSILRHAPSNDDPFDYSILSIYYSIENPVLWEEIEVYSSWFECCSSTCA